MNQIQTNETVTPTNKQKDKEGEKQKIVQHKQKN